MTENQGDDIQFNVEDLNLHPFLKDNVFNERKGVRSLYFIEEKRAEKGSGAFILNFLAVSMTAFWFCGILIK